VKIDGKGVRVVRRTEWEEAPATIGSEARSVGLIRAPVVLDDRALASCEAHFQVLDRPNAAEPKACRVQARVGASED
jgi:hypothetical protein